jgi:hypothetical protein
MAEFDPDAYLGKTTEFDPNKYLGLKPQEMDETARLAARYPAPLSAQIPGYGKPVPAARNEPNLSTGQLVYRNIARPVVAPTVEAMGAVGGGLLGTPAGPAGIVGGAGLGMFR